MIVSNSISSNVKLINRWDGLIVPQYIMYLDETGDHNLTRIDPSYRVFALTGCIFERTYYDSTAQSSIDSLKVQYWGNTNVILHSYEIRKRKGSFSILMEERTRTSFLSDLSTIMGSLQYTILSGVIFKDNLVTTYVAPMSPYTLTLEFLLERFYFFLRYKGSGFLVAEARGSSENRKLLDDFNNYLQHGTRFVSNKELQRHIKGLQFVPKSQNVVGCQIADLAAYPIARWAIDPVKSNPAFEVLVPKIYSSPEGRYLGWGVKIFP